LQEIKSVKVFNPLSQDQELMRPSLLPALIQVAQTNIYRGQKDVRIFENAKIYPSSGERNTLGVLLTGKRHSDWRASRKETVDFYDLKGSLSQMFALLDVEVEFGSAAHPSLDSSTAAIIKLNGKEIGFIGKLSQKVLQQWDIKAQDIYVAQVDTEQLMELPKKKIAYQPIAEFPAVVRDVSIAVKKEISYAQIEALAKQNGGSILKAVQFIEQYMGDKVPAGQKALVFSLVYQHPSRTLREEEITAVHQGILKSLADSLGALQR
jgi:phenylalanyl-tRNA synthetase beta chain